jgi:hypothetical protein
MTGREVGPLHIPRTPAPSDGFKWVMDTLHYLFK